MRWSAMLIVGAVCSIAACGGGAEKRFGQEPGPCAATVLELGPTDIAMVQEGFNCLQSEIDAGQSVVWDVLWWTTEGDPVPIRYEFDGTSVTITTDNSRDEYGDLGIVKQKCDALKPPAGDSLPKGVDCSISGGAGFDSESLPTP